MPQKKWSLIIVLLAAIFLFGATGPTASIAATTLTYSSFFPPTHIQSKLAESWCAEVEKRTEGRIKVQYFPGQTLTKAKQTYDSIVDGIADVGTSALAYTKGRFPVMGAIDLPFGYPSGLIATNAANALYAKMQPKEFEETQVMYFNAHGPGFIHTRDKAAKSLDDLKGLKLRSTGMSANVMKALGATPVPMPMPDTYQSLQKGVVDGSCYPVEANKGWKLGEVVDYVTKDLAAAYTTNFFVVMNKDKWASLDAKDQAIITKINQEWAVKHGEAWDSSDKEGLEFFSSQKGNEVVTLDKAESARWSKAVSPLIDGYAKDLDAKSLDGAKVVATIRAAIK